MPFSLDLQRQWTSASHLSSPEDLLPDGSLRLLCNARLDRSRGVVTSRPGTTQLTGSAIAASTAVTHVSQLFGVSADYSYAQCGTAFYRLTSSWATPTSLITGITGTIADTNWLDGYTRPWKFITGGATLKKDNGTSLTNWGITPPTAPPTSATLGTRNRVAIDAMDGTTTWVTAGVAGFGTEATIKQEGTNSLTFTVAASTLGTMTRTYTGANAFFAGTHTGLAGATFLTDGAASFVTLGVKRGATLVNVTAGFTGSVTRITATTLRFDAGLAGTFGIGDVYYLLFDLDSFQRIPGTADGTDNSGVNGKATSLVDTTRDFTRQGVRAGMEVWNGTTGGHGTITSIGTTTNTHDTLNFTGGLTGGSAAVFDSGQAYTVFNDLVKDDDWLHLWVRIDHPERLEFMQLDVDLGASFATDLYSVRIAPDRLSSGSNQWTELFVRKSEFQRFGTGAQTWKAIQSIRLAFQATAAAGGITVWVDDLSLLGGAGIEGDVSYTVVYANETTGGLSAPPKDDSEVVLQTTLVTAVRHPVTLSLANVQTPSDAQVTHLWIYRQGGALAESTFIATVPINTASFVDDLAPVQLDLSKVLEPDNDVPPATATMVFGPGAQQRLFLIYDRFKVRFSKAWEFQRSRGENWPSAFEFQIGDGSQEALNGIVLDQTAFVYSESATWEVLGQGPDAYVPIPVPLSRGLAAARGLAYGDGLIFKLCLDGIYMQQGVQEAKLTGDIDPFFQGTTMHGQLGISRSAMSTCRLEWYPHPTDPELILLYPDTSSSTPNCQLIVKKNQQTGRYTDCDFDSVTNLAYRAVARDPQALTLLYGGSDGHVYQGEVETATSDNSVAIVGRMRTRASDQGQPRAIKTYSDVVVECNSGGDTVAVTASFNRSTESVALGNATGTTNASHTQLTIPDVVASDMQRRNSALDLTWSSTNRVTISQIGWHVELQPEGILFVDSGNVSFEFITYLKWLVLDIDAPDAGQLTVKVYVENVLKSTQGFVVSAGRARHRLFLPAGLRGRVMRVTLTGSVAFQPWGMVGLTKPVGSALGYRETPMALLAG